MLVLLLVLLLAASPLWSIYGGRNSFANHDDFQYQYRHDSLNPAGGALAHLPAFYSQLRDDSEAQAIIEFPQVVWWSGTLYHRYQRIHDKRVLMGHPRQSYLIHAGVMHPDIRLQNSVDVQDREALRRSGARFIVIHKDIANESHYLKYVFRHGTDQGFVRPDPAKNTFEQRYGQSNRMFSSWLISAYRATAGAPSYEDEWIAVFAIDRLLAD